MGDWTSPERRFSQLGQRLLTAAVLIPTGLFVVWNGGWWLAAACAFFGAIMAWEWAGMSGHPRGGLIGLATSLFCLALPLKMPAVLISIAVFGLATHVRFASGQRADTFRLSIGLGICYWHGCRALGASGRSVGWTCCRAILHVLRVGLGCCGVFRGAWSWWAPFVASREPEQNLERRNWRSAVHGCLRFCCCGHTRSEFSMVDRDWICALGDSAIRRFV